MELSIIQSKIYEIRGRKVILDYDLSAMYQVETRAINQQVKKKQFIFLLFILTLFSGCNPDDICLSNQHALQSNFFSMENKNRVIVPGTTIFGLGMSNDSIYKNEDVSSMFLPLSFDKDTTSFVVIRQSVLKDTIHFVHSKKLTFISRNCGFTFDFKLDTVYFTGLFIDSISIVNRNIKYNENFDNVEIYIY